MKMEPINGIKVKTREKEGRSGQHVALRNCGICAVVVVVLKIRAWIQNRSETPHMINYLHV